MEVKKETWIRTICLAIALINQILTATGHSVLPITDDMVSQVVTAIVTTVVAIWTFWKNNSFTKEAIAADNLLANLRKANNK